MASPTDVVDAKKSITKYIHYYNYFIIIVVVVFIFFLI